MQLIIDLVLSLKNVEIFSEIPDHVIAEIAEIIEVQEYSKGETFIRKGELGDCMYVIRNGAVRVHDGSSTLATLGQNDIVGELSLLAPVQRTADVTALEDVILFAIGREYFLELVADEPSIMDGLLKVLVQRIIQLNEKLKVSQGGS